MSNNSTSHIFKNNDVIWVRLRRNLWWPGLICEESKLPDGLLDSLKTKPLLVVSFFSEDKFEYVKNISNVCEYNDPRKSKFIKTALEVNRSNTHQMDKFSDDIRLAEALTNGNPDILNEDEYLPSVIKSVIEIDKTPKHRKKSTKSTKTPTNVSSNKKRKIEKTPNTSNDSYSDNRINISSFYSNRSSDTEFTILTQADPNTDIRTEINQTTYRCHFCNYSTKRYNLLKYHFLEHRNGSSIISTTSDDKKENKTNIEEHEIHTRPDTPVIDSEKEEFSINTEISPIKKRSKSKFDTSTPQVKELPQVKETNKSNKSEKKKRKHEVEKVIDSNEINNDDDHTVKKVKPIELELTKQKLLEDWSEDESDHETQNKSIENKHTSNSKSDKILTENLDNDLINEKKENENHINNSTPVTKYRNIPKKDREREFIFEEANDQNNLESNELQNETNSNEIVQENELKSRIPTNKPEYINIKKDIIKTRIVSPDLTEEQEQLNDNIDDNVNENEQKERLSTTSPVLEISENKDESVRRSQTPEIRKSFGSDNNSSPKIQEDKSANKLVPKPSEISCFDFQDDEDLELAKSPPKRQQRQRKSLLSQSLEKDKVNENEIKDKQIESEVELLLKTTSLPTLPDLPKDRSLSDNSIEENSPNKSNDEMKSDNLEQKDRALPPKERGKRIFKSRNRSKFSIENDVNLIIKKDILDSQNDSLQSSKTPSDSVLQIAETLINIPEIIPQIQQSKEKEIINKILEDNNKLDENSIHNRSDDSNHANNGNTVHVSRKKHLQAAFKAEEEEKVKNDSIIDVNVVNQEKGVEIPSLSPKQKFVLKLKEESQSKFEPRTPKKRKQTLEDDMTTSLEKSQTILDKNNDDQSSGNEKNSENTMDDSVFDISNMEIVLSDNIESVPFLVEASTASTASTDVYVSPIKNEEIISLDTIKSRSSRKSLKSKSGRRKKTELIDEGPSSSFTSKQNFINSNENNFDQVETTIQSRRRSKKSTRSSTSDNETKEPKYTIVTKKSENDNKIIIKKTPERVSDSGKASIISSETLTLSNESIVLPKGKIVQAGTGDKIVITSKGQLITTDTPFIVTNTKTTVGSYSIEKENNLPSKKIEVQSQKILNYPEETEKKKLIKITKKGKGNEKSEKYVRMSPKRLAEMSRLGLIKNHGQDKVIKSSAFKKFAQEQKRQNAIEKNKSSNSNLIEEITNENENLIDEPSTSNVTHSTKIDQEIQEESEGENVTIIVPSEEKVNSDSFLDSTNSDTAIVAQQTTSGSEITENYYALPAENYGGPPNSFYLCRKTGQIDDTNQFAPIDDRALYLDPTNRLVERMPETNTVQNEGIIETAQINETVGDMNQLQEIPAQSFLINTGDGQQILVDQQSLLSLAAGEMPHLITADGQQIIIQGSAQDIITALAVNQAEMNIIAGDQQIIIPQAIEEGQSVNSDILAVALEATDVYPSSESLIGNVLIQTQTPQSDIICDQTMPTATVLSKPPIMSTLEVPTNKAISETTPNLTLESGLNIDDSLAVIGVTTTNSNVPSSLELPITVTNPAIASKTSPLSLNTIYTPPISAIGSISHVSPISPSLDYELFESTVSVPSTSSTSSSSVMNNSNKIEKNKSNLLQENKESKFNTENIETEDDINSPAIESNENSNDNIIPQSPGTDNPHVSNEIHIPVFRNEDEDDNSSEHSDEIPLQSNLVIHSNNYVNNNNSNYNENSNNTNTTNNVVTENEDNMIIINGNFIKIDNITEQSDDER